MGDEAKWTRRHLMQTAGAAAAGAALGAGARAAPAEGPSAPAKRPPNIILCIADQLRAFEVGCYGNPVIRTPNLDRLAGEGVRFETAVTNFPVCMAARSVLLSGQANRTCTGGVGNVTWPSRPDDCNMPEYPDPGRPHLPQTTLPEALRAAGYHTAVIGKWHVHSWPGDVGFDRYLIPRVHHCHVGQSFTEDGGPEFVPSGVSVDFEAGRVKEFLEGRQGRPEPFFLYYSISPPHCPFADLPEKYLRMYRPEDVPLRANVDLSKPIPRLDHWLKVYRYDFRYYNLHLPYAERLPEGYGLRHAIAEYYGATTYVDDTVGRMLAALEAAGLARDTIVIFTADHGDNLGSHGLVQKGGPNEESVRVPLLWRWPAGLPAGAVVRDRAAGLVDVAPTLLGLVGGAPPAHWHGRSLAPHFGGATGRAGHDGSIIETGGGIGIRTPAHLCFLPFGRGHALADKPSQFFDLRADPLQQRNLAEGDAEDPVRRDLHARLAEWDRTTPWMKPPRI